MRRSSGATTNAMKLRLAQFRSGNEVRLHLQTQPTRQKSCKKLLFHQRSLRKFMCLIDLLSLKINARKFVHALQLIVQQLKS